MGIRVNPNGIREMGDALVKKSWVNIKVITLVLGGNHHRFLRELPFHRFKNLETGKYTSVKNIKWLIQNSIQNNYLIRVDIEDFSGNIFALF